MKLIFRLIRKLAPKTLKNFFRQGRDFLTWDEHVNRSWSQEGEDIVLRRIFNNKKNGFYVDVGAHHPTRFSNTYLFYRDGWAGINIDANPGSMRIFKKKRSRDINLELGVAQKKSTLDYYVFNEPALNGFSAELSHQRNSAENNYKIKEVLKINVSPLSEILNQYLEGHKIDFLNVDVEGLDLEVLKSNDWSKYRPKIVVAEMLNRGMFNIDQDPLVKFMRVQGYSVFAKQVYSVFFKDIKFKIDF